MFNEEEIKLLNATYETLVGRTHVFDIFSNSKWRNTGIENWAQTELIVALTDRNYDVTTKGKVKRDCDIIVKKDFIDLGIELKCMTYSKNYRTTLINEGLINHPNADLFIFLAKVDEPELEGLCDYCTKEQYVWETSRLNDEWILMLVKKQTN